MCSTAPPGYPNTTSTPKSESDLTKISAPLSFTSSPNHRARPGRPDERRVPGEVSGRDLGRRCFPGPPAPGELRGGDVEHEFPFWDIEDDCVPVPDQGDRAPFHRLRRNVADARPVRSP